MGRASANLTYFFCLLICNNRCVHMGDTDVSGINNLRADLYRKSELKT